MRVNKALAKLIILMAIVSGVVTYLKPEPVSDFVVYTGLLAVILSQILLMSKR